MATLIVMAGPSEGKTCALQASTLVSVGRDDQCTFQIVDDEIRIGKSEMIVLRTLQME